MQGERRESQDTKGVVTMQQQVHRPTRRAETQRAHANRHEVWPLSAREFMKLPVSGLLSGGNRLVFIRPAPPESTE